ncbi:Pectinesterase, active site-containing protein [Artemisia annua]|uniref:Pectinesterase, active site-containing protein n=1 Tax=Artemisia annua TaxID=35608 RepID=A0A2U1LMK0_ARTAN|nr:Pectinesterase, active site-containing protein [Artemisia annua]
MTLQRVGRALYTSAGISTVQMNTRVRSAYDDCLELLEDSVDQLQRSLFSVAPSKNGKMKVGSSEDVMTWLSAALTNQDTCTDGLAEVENGYVKQQMEAKLKDLSQMVSNCLAIYAAAASDDFDGVPIQHRRLMSYPEWLGKKERRLLQAPVGVIQPDIVVSKDGNGTWISTVQMNTRVRSAYDDCLELLEDSVDQLQRSLFSVAPSKNGKMKVGSSEDVMTWLSAALTNQDTCTDGLAEVENGYVKQQMEAKLKDLSQMVSNCLAIYAAAASDDFDGVPIQHRRLMSYPEWLGKKERRLLQAPVGVIQPDIVVSKDGNGTCTTIAEAIKKAPEYSSRRIIIYVRAGR